jgi:hypothetical protein
MTDIVLMAMELTYKGLVSLEGVFCSSFHMDRSPRAARLCLQWFPRAHSPPTMLSRDMKGQRRCSWPVPSPTCGGAWRTFVSQRVMGLPFHSLI